MYKSEDIKPDNLLDIIIDTDRIEINPDQLCKHIVMIIRNTK